jgi:hypothetical protein
MTCSIAACSVVAFAGCLAAGHAESGRAVVALAPELDDRELIQGPEPQGCFQEARELPAVG